MTAKNRFTSSFLRTLPSAVARRGQREEVIALWTPYGPPMDSFDGPPMDPYGTPYGPTWTRGSKSVVDCFLLCACVCTS